MLYLGFKWDVTANTNGSLTRYTLYPEISSENILDKIDSTYLNHSNAQARSLKYLEVTEDNSSRKSFDINLYEAGLKTHDIYAELIAMQKHYKIDAQNFMNFITLSSTKILAIYLAV